MQCPCSRQNVRKFNQVYEYTNLVAGGPVRHFKSAKLLQVRVDDWDSYEISQVKRLKIQVLGNLDHSKYRGGKVLASVLTL